MHPELVRIGKDIILRKNKVGKLIDIMPEAPIAVFQLKDGTNVSVEFSRKGKNFSRPEILIREKDSSWKILKDTGEVMDI
jgi:hypothetical protein